jgi:UDP-N-acetyl-D-mannosaminuronic acid dehydrogenase
VKFDKICILGLGYTGLPTAATFATHGLRVVGVDINPAVITTLQNGDIHIHEPGLHDLVQEAISSGNLTVQGEPEPADAFVIEVPTPFYHDERGVHEGKPYRLADMRAVESATQAIVPHLGKGNLVVLESTSPPRTTVDLLVPILERSGLKAGVDFLLAYTPERVLPGNILRELVENDRVIGGIDPASAQAGRDLFGTFVHGEIVLTDATTAEMVKLMENTYRDINVAAANEFSRLADRFGVDIWEAVSLANRHPRVKILRPGPGVGGHCVSVDPWFLVQAAPQLASLIHTARLVNDSQPVFVLESIRKAAGPLAGKRIAVLGLAFKEDVDDLRESPAVEITRMLVEQGAKVKAYEPYKPDAHYDEFETVPELAPALEGADVIVILAGHKPFKDLDPRQVASQTPARLVMDTRNVCDPAAWKAAGFRLVRLGDGKSKR